MRSILADLKPAHPELAEAKLFDSLQELFAVQPTKVNIDGNASRWAKKCWAKSEKEGQQVLQNIGFSADWDGGVSTVAGFKEFVNGGWREGVAKMREAIGTLNVAGVTSIKRRPKWRDEGDELDIQRVYSGDLDRAWWSSERKIVSGVVQHVRVLVAAAALSSVESSDMFWRGAVACILVDALEEAGYRVEVGAFAYSDHPWITKRGRTLAGVPLKAFDEPLDIERMAACTAHAGFFRTAIFAERMSSEWECGKRLGSTIHSRPPHAEEGDIVIDNVWSQDAAKAMLDKIVSGFSPVEKPE